MNLVPPAEAILGIGVLAFGIRPRTASVVVYSLLGLVAADRDRRWHRRRQPLGTRYVGVPPDGFIPRCITALGANGVMTAIGCAGALVGERRSATGPPGRVTPALEKGPGGGCAPVGRSPAVQGRHGSYVESCEAALSILVRRDTSVTIRRLARRSDVSVRRPLPPPNLGNAGFNSKWPKSAWRQHAGFQGPSSHPTLDGRYSLVAARPLQRRSIGQFNRGSLSDNPENRRPVTLVASNRIRW